ncbi:MAG: MFS transporter [Alcaligenaceae bacterium]|nr:MFS transporter [Alcaligenaceae bacterium]
MSTQTTKLKLTPLERKTSASLALLFAVRMLGLFLLTPVFADAAKTLVQGDNPLMIGIAIGAYGLTQSVMQIPMGLLSDRFGRRSVVIFGMLLFVIGGIVCALAPSVTWVAIGRGIQGFGAVSAAITAWVADSTRPEVRSRAMAMVGASIGLSFAISMVMAPLVVEWFELSGLFWTISILGFLCLLLAVWVVPVVPQDHQAINRSFTMVEVLGSKSLWLLNLSVFSLHFVLMAIFVVIPPVLIRLGDMSIGQLWQVYLPVIVVALIFMIPAVMTVEKKRMHKEAIGLTLLGIIVSLGIMISGMYSFVMLVLALLLYFIPFNILEALLPSAVSRTCPPEHKGLALGVFNMTQALGVASGGFLGGLVAAKLGNPSVFVMAIVLCAISYLATRRVQINFVQ